MQQPYINIVITKIIIMELNNFKIMGNSTNDYHLQLKESLLILKLKPSLNIAKESTRLHLFEIIFNGQ